MRYTYLPTTLPTVKRFARRCLTGGKIWMVSLAGLLAASASNARGAATSEEDAIAIADLWYASELNSEHTGLDQAETTARLGAVAQREVLYLVSKEDLAENPPDDGEVLAYVVKYKPSGFVVVSGDDRTEPVIAFGVESEFHWEHPGPNFLRYFLGKTMVDRRNHVSTQVAAGVAMEVHPNWAALRSQKAASPGLATVSLSAAEETILVEWETADWDQGSFYNDLVVARNGNTAGIPTGCTATAMAIKMRFHEWPGTGNGTHTYTDSWDSVRFSHTANFGAHTYNWANMPTADLTGPNADVAALMYHCGVAVNMNYEVGGSGAWPSASEMNTHFRYRGTTQRTSGHEAPMIASVRGGLPVVLSSSSHTVVADGYRNSPSPYFHLNIGHGWGGAWYDLNQIPSTDPTIDRSYPYSCPSDYIYVDASWTGAENGNLQTPYNTLSEGVSAVPSAGCLWLKSGSYLPMTVSKAMTITSYEGTATIGG